MKEIIGEKLVQTARLSFLLHIVFAAAAYGLTREEGIRAFNWSMGITVAAWLLGCLIKGNRPKIGFFLPFFTVSLLALGWFVTLAAWWDPSTENALPASEWASDFAFRVATFDYVLSFAAMVRTSVLLGALLLAADLFADARWTRALFLTIGVTATGMVGYFFLQKIAPEVFRLRSLDENVWLTFATYRYHGNAAAFLNLMWPVLAGIALQMALVRGRGWSIWLGGTLLVFASLYVNLSKAGQALGLVGLLAFAFFAAIHILRNERHIFRRISWPIVLAAGIPLLILFSALPFAMPWQRWDALMGGTMENNDRLQAYRLFVKLLPDTGWTGFGAGTFNPVHLQYFSEEPILQGYPFWVAHEDYLQTAVEWGYAGVIIWGLILLPGALPLLSGRASAPSRSRSTENSSYEFGIADRFQKFFNSIPTSDAPLVKRGAFIAVGLTALHAAVDFPMQVASLQFYFLIWIGLGWRALRENAARRKHPLPEDSLT